MHLEMTGFAPVSVRLPIRAIPLLDEVSERHGVTRHRLMQAVLQMAARDPDGLILQALAESPSKRELSQILCRFPRKE